MTVGYCVLTNSVVYSVANTICPHHTPASSNLYKYFPDTAVDVTYTM